MNQARSLHEIFESDYQAPGSLITNRSLPFKSWWATRWAQEIDTYGLLGWAMIPIIVRGKIPLKSAGNYLSRGAAGPYLSFEEACSWAEKGFNLAVAAGPSKIIWCDIDSPRVLNRLVPGRPLMRTPRGFAIPIKPDKSATVKRIRALKKQGFDFRQDVTYELVPLSVTCTFDHDLHGKKHPGPRDPCFDNHPHDYRVREWMTPLSAVTLLTFKELWEAYKA